MGEMLIQDRSEIIDRPVRFGDCLPGRSSINCRFLSLLSYSTPVDSSICHVRSFTTGYDRAIPSGDGDGRNACEWQPAGVRAAASLDRKSCAHAFCHCRNLSSTPQTYTPPVLCT